MSRVLLVDYGVGNLLSVARALQACGGDVLMSGNPADLAHADRVVLPGVGAFGNCMAELVKRELTEPVMDFARSGKPMLGICVGMQILLNSTEEFGEHQGLGLIPGKVQAIPATTADGQPHKIPHIGWTALAPATQSWESGLMAGVEPGSSCYFVHSFTAHPTNPAHRLADTDYHGRPIAAAVQDGNLFGTQFHPEKSGAVGLRILQNFLAIA